MAKTKRKVPGINASSTADISFMLLIFFLITTSMDTDRGVGETFTATTGKYRKPRRRDCEGKKCSSGTYQQGRPVDGRRRMV